VQSFCEIGRDTRWVLGSVHDRGEPPAGTSSQGELPPSSLHRERLKASVLPDGSRSCGTWLDADRKVDFITSYDSEGNEIAVGD
jgi:hypothetical protein